MSSRSSSVTSASRSIAVTCFLRSAISLKRLNALLSAWPETSKPSSSSACCSAWRPECLPSTIALASRPTVRRVHDLVGRALLEHAVLVDAGLVRERVAPDDRLVGLHRRSRSGARPGGWCARSRVVSMPVCRPPTSAPRVCSSITISSSEALPARSPMPLIAHSTWRAPASTPANELATASPRSSWQWTETTTSRRPGTSS